MKSLKNRKIFMILILICSLQCVLSLFWASRKSYLSPDELFSYVSANNIDYIGEIPKNTWLDHTWYEEYVSANEDHTFEYSIPFQNQEKDVHPPLFYFLLHTACSLIPGEFSFWAGTGVNLLIFLACTIGLYYLVKETFSSRCGLLVAFLFGVSDVGVNTLVFVRMYMLMTLFVILHAYVYMKYFDRDKITAKGCWLLAITLILGMMTQYYFVLIAFFFALWYGIRFLYNKEWKKLAKFVSVFIGSAITCILIYPPMIHHIFGTSRATEAREKFVASEGYFENLKKMWEILNSQIFSKVFLLLIIVIFVLLIVCLKKKKEMNDIPFAKTGAILLTCVGYFLLVTKIAPYQIDRYLMPIYPLIYLLVVGFMYSLMKKLISEKFAMILCIIGFCGWSVLHMLHAGIPYTFSDDIVITPRLDVTEEYGDCYALYVGNEDEMYAYFDALQVLKEYKGFYNLEMKSDVSEIQKDMMKISDEERIVLYVEDKMNLDKVRTFIEQLFPEKAVNLKNRLHKDENWEVYLIEDRAVEEETEIRINLPETLYAFSGIPLEIYNRQVTNQGEEIVKYNVRWNCEVGENLKRKYCLNPTDEMEGTYVLNCEIYDNELNLVAKDSCTLKITGKKIQKEPDILTVTNGLQSLDELRGKDAVCFRAKEGTEEALLKAIKEIRDSGIKIPIYIGILPEIEDLKKLDSDWAEHYGETFSVCENVYVIPSDICIDVENYEETAEQQMDALVQMTVCGTIS